jgi:outer membrane protein OmpA-like peptidoglycan-associated protein
MTKCRHFLRLLILMHEVRAQAQRPPVQPPLQIHARAGITKAPETKMPAWGHADKIDHDTIMVHFPFNSYHVSDHNGMVLKAYLQSPGWLTGNIRSIQITGHTDSKGSAPYNRRLSVKRARSVENFIKSNVLLPSTVTYRLGGMGKEQPVSNIDSLNRRTAIIFTYTVGGRNKNPVAVKDSGMTSVKLQCIDSPLIGQRLQGESAPPAAPMHHETIEYEIDTVMTLTYIYFVEERPWLTPSSIMAMPSVIRNLNKYKSSILEIDGYCNSLEPNLSESDPLFKLSVARAKVICEYLVDAGFDPNKMTYKGLGNSVLKISHPATDDEARENMRVEIKIYKQKIRPKN